MKFFSVILLATAIVSKSSCIPEPPEPKECVAQRGIPCTFAKCGECGSAGGTYDQYADCTIVVHCGGSGGSSEGPGCSPLGEVVHELDTFGG